MTIGWRLGLLGWVAAAAALALAVALAGGTGWTGQQTLAGEPGSEQRVALSELPWVRAHAGRAVLISEGLPARDAAPDGTALRLAGVAYDRGLSVGGGSEIVYALNGHYSRFDTIAGLSDDSYGDAPALRFLVFLDDMLAYDSDVVRPGDEPQQVTLELAGMQQLRLATQGVEGQGVWADAWLSVAGPNPRPSGRSPFLTRLFEQQAHNRAARDLNRTELDGAAAAEGRRLKALQAEPASYTVGTVQNFLTTDSVTIANGQLGVTLGMGGSGNGRLTVFDQTSERLVVHSVAPAVELASGERYSLADAVRLPDGAIAVREVDVVGFGSGLETVARFRSGDGALEFRTILQLFDQHPALLYQISIGGAAKTDQAAFFFLDPEAGGVLPVGDDAQYLTDFNRLRQGGLPDDGLRRDERVGHGKPVWVWSDQERSGVLLAAIDETQASPFVTFRRDPGQAGVQMTFGAGRARNADGLGSPRLYIEATHTPHLQDAFSAYRGAMAALYPPLPLPEWVRHQWLSWYLHYFDISDAALSKQVDYATANLDGVGPWHLLVDAGWYVGEGRPEADWRNVDRAKFPDGLRAFVEDAHRRGVKIVLYFGAPYLNTQELAGNWMGMTGMIRQFTDWLIFTGGDEITEHYLMDFSRPELRSYVQDVMADFFLEYRVDGMKLDGLGSAEGDPPPVDAGAAWVLDPRAVGQTMDIYRVMYAAAENEGNAPYIESGWSNPVFAHPYSHTFRYGDESEGFSNPYPGGGLVEHIDYAAFQAAIGQPANMGAILGDPNTSAVPRWWLGAALAMGNQVALSFDLTGLEWGARDHFRALMAHYAPFIGSTVFDGKLKPEVFATTNGPLTYLGVVNREPGLRPFDVDLTQYGIAPDAEVTVYDVEADRFMRPGEGRLLVDVEGESFRLFVLRSSPGVLWTTGGFDEQASDAGLTMTLRGPAVGDGFVQLASPHPEWVGLEGTTLEHDDAAVWPSPGRWSYDDASGVLTVALPSGDGRTLTVAWEP